MNIRSPFVILRPVLGLLLMLSFPPGRVNAADPLRCFVDANAYGTNTGQNWQNAYTSLQLALGTSPCTEIWVADGVYSQIPGADRSLSFVLKNGVSLYGGFAGGETDFSQQNPAVNVSILSGEIGAPGIADNSYHVVIASNTNLTAVLDGFTITAGSATGSSGSYLYGGGMFNYMGSPSLAHLIFTGNSAVYGAGMSNSYGAQPSLSDVIFSSNAAGSTPESGGRGGAMDNYQANPILTNVTFKENAAYYGGALYNDQSSPNLTNVTFNGNAGHFGAAIANAHSSPALTNATFYHNTAVQGGALMNWTSSSPVIKNSILYGDTGGEISDDASAAVVSYSIVDGGYAGTGILTGDPKLQPLGYYGGRTMSQPLGYGSAAIDTGTNTGCPLYDQRALVRPQDGNGDGIAACDMGATESRLVRKTFYSVGSQDGWVLESSELSETGGTLGVSDGTFRLGDESADRQYRSILSFNTKAIPDYAVVTSAVLKIKRAGLVGSNPFGTHGKIYVDIRIGALSGNAALQLRDFNSAASQNSAMLITNSPVSGWYSKALGAAKLSLVNPAGLTQLRLRFASGDNDDNSADYLKFFSGNYVTTAYRPRFIVTYYLY